MSSFTTRFDLKCHECGQDGTFIPNQGHTFIEAIASLEDFPQYWFVNDHSGPGDDPTVPEFYSVTCHRCHWSEEGAQARETARLQTQELVDPEV